jgi:hypothetical protein
MTLRFSIGLVALTLTSAACTASIGGSDPNGLKPGDPGYVAPGGLGSGGPNGGPGSPSGGGASAAGGAGSMTADPNAAGPMPLRRLNHREFNNTVRDLLGVTTHPADAFPLDLDSGFLFHRAGLVSTLDASVLRDAAEAIAKTVDVTPLLPCAAASGDDACASQFINSFGARAFRRPVAAAEAARLLALYQDARTAQKLDFTGATRVLIEAIVQAPGFLYRWELGPNAPTLDGNVARLTGYEVASRLSYFFWRSMPDQALFDAAAADQLATPEAVEAQARRLLADDKAKDTVSAFFDEWLGLEELPERPKNISVYPEFSADLANSMLDENHSFVAGVLFGGDGSFRSLLTGSSATLPSLLGPIYGASAGQVALNPAQRSGLFTRAGFLTLTGSTTGSHPAKRGRKVFERILCGTLPPPPPNVPPAKPASAGGTTRMRFTEHDQNPCAKGCHSLMDPLGFAFEHYDGIGRYRDLDNGLPVDSSTSVDVDGTSHAIANALELSSLLADSPTAHQCFAAQWARFALQRDATEADAASLAAVGTAFSSHDFNIGDLLVGVASSRTFRYRSLAEGEVVQ